METQGGERRRRLCENVRLKKEGNEVDEEEKEEMGKEEEEKIGKEEELERGKKDEEEKTGKEGVKVKEQEEKMMECFFAKASQVLASCFCIRVLSRQP